MRIEVRICLGSNKVRYKHGNTYIRHRMHISFVRTRTSRHNLSNVHSSKKPIIGFQQENNKAFNHKSAFPPFEWSRDRGGGSFWDTKRPLCCAETKSFFFSPSGQQCCLPRCLSVSPIHPLRGNLSWRWELRSCCVELLLRDIATMTKVQQQCAWKAVNPSRQKNIP